MMEAVEQKNIVSQFFIWHFYEAPKSILFAWRNVLLFTIKYFSFEYLLKTLFCHWRKYQDSYGQGFDFKKYSQAFVFNMLSRILGAVIRAGFIVFGLLFLFVVFLIGLLVLLFWLFLPFLILLGFIFSGYLLVI